MINNSIDLEPAKSYAGNRCGMVGGCAPDVTAMRIPVIKKMKVGIVSYGKDFQRLLCILKSSKTAGLKRGQAS